MDTFDNQVGGLGGGTFTFSGVGLGDLGASAYTIVGIACDCSGSMSGHERNVEKALKSIISACRRSPRGDNLLIRLLRFSTGVRQIHGFKALRDCNDADYDGTMTASGSTSLYDACYDLAGSLAEYGKFLQDNNYSANGIFFVVTDGCDYGSKLTAGSVKAALQEVAKKERLESVISVLIGINVTDPMVAAALTAFAQEVGFTQYVPVGNADESTIAKLAAFMSKSISSQSQALGTGGPSKTLTF